MKPPVMAASARPGLTRARRIDAALRNRRLVFDDGCFFAERAVTDQLTKVDGDALLHDFAEGRKRLDATPGTFGALRFALDARNDPPDLAEISKRAEGIEDGFESHDR